MGFVPGYCGNIGSDSGDDIFPCKGFYFLLGANSALTNQTTMEKDESGGDLQFNRK
jgi:hypothetical protein